MNNMQHSKNAFMQSACITAIIGIVLGLLLIFIDTNALLTLVFVVMGVITVVGSLPGVLRGIGEIASPQGKAMLLLSSISLILGLLMIFWNNGILMILLGVYMLLFPVVNILLATDKLVQLTAEAPKLIIGFVLILLGPAGTFGLLFDIAGGVLILLSVLHVIRAYLTLRRHQHTTGSRIFVDTDGNGTIDAVYVDTDGNGEADTATHYKEQK